MNEGIVFVPVEINDRHVGEKCFCLTEEGQKCFGNVYLETRTLRWYCEVDSPHYVRPPYITHVLETVKLPSIEEIQDEAIAKTNSRTAFLRGGRYVLERLDLK